MCTIIIEDDGQARENKPVIPVYVKNKNFSFLSHSLISLKKKKKKKDSPVILKIIIKFTMIREEYIFL